MTCLTAPQSEIVAALPELERMSEMGMTSWIDEDWGAAFFEMQLVPSEVFKVRGRAARVGGGGGAALLTLLARALS